MVPNCAATEDLLKAIKDEKVQMIDLRFTDLPGVWQHFSVPPSAVNIDALNEGIGFDGSSIRGFQEIQESDMLVVPDPTTVFVDPFTPATTLVLICNIRDPVTGQSYSRDPRYIAQKAETYLKGAGRADTSYFGPEAEFFRIQRRALRTGHQLRLPRNRFQRGQLEHRQEGNAEFGP
jgi:glutamine synthetase